VSQTSIKALPKCRYKSRVVFVAEFATSHGSWRLYSNKTGSVVVCTEEAATSEAKSDSQASLALSWFIRREGALESIQTPAGCRA
jgi:hypothetical protein